MSTQVIYVQIKGSAPNYQVSFSADPDPVPHGSTANIVYEFTPSTSGFSFIGLNSVHYSRPASGGSFGSSVGRGAQSLTITDVNTYDRAVVIGFQITFEDAAGHQFSSTDPEVQNEGPQ